MRTMFIFKHFPSAFLLSCLSLLLACNQINGGKTNSISGQLSSDCLKGNQNIKEYQPLHDSCFELIRSIKVTSSSQGEGAIQKAKPIVDELLPFFLAFEKHKQLTAELEALSEKLGAGLVPENEAKQSYDTLIVAWRNAADQLPGGAAAYQKTKATFLEAFPNPIK